MGGRGQRFQPKNPQPGGANLPVPINQPQNPPQNPTGQQATPAQPRQINTISDVQTFDELKEYMKNNHNLTVDDSVDGADIQILKDSIAKIEEINKELPGLQKVLRKDEDGNLTKSIKPWNAIKTYNKPGAMAGASFSGYIGINMSYFSNKDNFQKALDGGIKSGFHPNGGLDSIMVHEYGHLIERALINKNITDFGFWGESDRSKAWNKGTYSTKIIANAAKAVKKTDSGKDANGNAKTNDQLVREVSRYATYSRSEALAECVADYMSNGSNANALSIAVWAELKKEFG